MAFPYTVIGGFSEKATFRFFCFFWQHVWQSQDKLGGKAADGLQERARHGESAGRVYVKAGSAGREALERLAGRGAGLLDAVAAAIEQAGAAPQSLELDT